MKYIRNGVIYETPVKAMTDEGEITLNDFQCNLLGYVNVDSILNHQKDFQPEEYVQLNLSYYLQMLLQLNMPSECERINVGVVKAPIKIGYKCETTFKDGVINIQYVDDPNGLGTKNIPFIFVDGVTLYPEAYYMYEDKVYGYTGKSMMIAENWDSVKELMKL